MERQAFNSLNEAALQVQLNEDDKKVKVKTQSGSTENVSKGDLKAAGSLYDRLMSSKLDKKKFGTAGVYKVDTIHGKPVKKESVELALEYFENYFDGQLNESTSDEDIMEAVYGLVGLTEAVLEAISPEELIEAKGKLVPHEAFTKLKKRQSPSTRAMDAMSKEVVQRKSNPKRRTNVPNQELRDVDVHKQIINRISATGRKPTYKEFSSFVGDAWKRNNQIDK